VRNESLEDGHLYHYLSETWRNGTQGNNEELEHIWSIIKGEEDGPMMMLSLLMVILGDKTDYEMIGERREILSDIMEVWVASEQKSLSDMQAITELGYSESLGDETLKALYRLLLLNGDVDILTMWKLSTWGEKVEVSIQSVLSRILEMEDWKWITDKLLCILTNEIRSEHGEPIEISEMEGVEDSTVESKADEHETEQGEDEIPLEEDVETEHSEEEIPMEQDVETEHSEEIPSDSDIDKNGPHEIDIETIKMILKERHKMDKNGVPLKPHKSHVGWSDAAHQHYDRWKTFLGEQKTAKLWEMKDYIMGKMKPTDEWKYNTASAHISAFSVLLRNLNEDEVITYVGSKELWQDLKNLIAEQFVMIAEIKEVDEEFQKMSPREKQIVGSTTWDDIVSAVIKYVSIHKSPNTLMNKEQLRLALRLVILRLYVLDHAPRRLEYMYLKWRNYDPDKDNYYDDGVITLNDYKTVKQHGQYRIGVAIETRELFEKIILVREEEDNDFVFGKENEVLRDSFRTGLVNEAFEISCKLHPISVQILRKLYIEDKRKKGELEWTTQRKECARQCGHTEKLQQTRYKKREREAEGELTSESEHDNIVGIQPAKRRTRTKRRYATEEERTALLEGIDEWERQHGTDGYSWTKIWNSSPVLRNVPPITVKRWGLNMVKTRKDIQQNAVAHS